MNIQDLLALERHPVERQHQHDVEDRRGDRQPQRHLQQLPAAADQAAAEPGSAQPDGHRPVHPAAGRVQPGRAADRLQQEPGAADQPAILHQRLQRGQLPRQRGGGGQRPGQPEGRQGQVPIRDRARAPARPSCRSTIRAARSSWSRKPTRASAATTSIGTARTPSATSCPTASIAWPFPMPTSRARPIRPRSPALAWWIRPRSPTARSNCSSARSVSRSTRS